LRAACAFAVFKTSSAKRKVVLGIPGITSSSLMSMQRKEHHLQGCDVDRGDRRPLTRVGRRPVCARVRMTAADQHRAVAFTVATSRGALPWTRSASSSRIAIRTQRS
jgi:hypothetical protein